MLLTYPDPTDAAVEGYFLDMNIGGNGTAEPNVLRGLYSGDPRGEIVVDICDNYESGYSETGEYRTKVINFEIRLKKTFVNQWFGTKY